MPVTSKLHVIRQVLSMVCKGPGFDTIWSKVLNGVRCILGEYYYKLWGADVWLKGLPRLLSFGLINTLPATVQSGAR